jgi:hypothetical protein
VLTKEDGTKMYASTLIFWEKPTGALRRVLQYQCRTWYLKNINASDLEYLNYLKSQIQELSSILAQTSRQEMQTIYVEEKLKLFNELLKPFTTNACVDSNNLWIARSLCLLSSFPIFEFMEDYLKCLYFGIMDNNGTKVSLEACLINLICELPVPPLGRKEISIRAFQTDLYFHRAPPNELPFLKNVR